MKKLSCFKKLLPLASILAALLVMPAVPLQAEEEKPSGDFTTAFLNRYVWRGYELSRNSPVIQPSMTMGYKGFSANLWGNLDTRPYSPAAADYTGTWNETDLTLAYSKTMGMFTLGGGYIYYGLAPLNLDAPDRPDSQELFASLSLNTLLSPTMTIYKEVDHYRNWYFLFGVSHAIELTKMMSLKLSASASYLLSTDAGTYPKFDSSALPTTDKFSNFHDGSVSASLPLKVTEYITVTPLVSYIFPLTQDAEDEMKGLGLKGAASPSERDSSFFLGGVTVSLSF